MEGRRIPEAAESSALEFRLTEDERDDRLTSGEARFQNECAGPARI